MSVQGDPVFCVTILIFRRPLLHIYSSFIKTCHMSINIIQYILEPTYFESIQNTVWKKGITPKNRNNLSSSLLILLPACPVLMAWRLALFSRVNQTNPSLNYQNVKGKALRLYFDDEDSEHRSRIRYSKEKSGVDARRGETTNKEPRAIVFIKHEI